MNNGYGRGYYGNEQLDQPKRSSGGGWFKIAAAVAIGTAAWFLWPKKSQALLTLQQHAPPQPPPPPPQDFELAQLEQSALARGYPSLKTYEDSVIASARELKAAGSKVELAPHLRYLEARVE